MLFQMLNKKFDKYLILLCYTIITYPDIAFCNPTFFTFKYLIYS